MPYTTHELTRALRAAAQAFLSALEPTAKFVGEDTAPVEKNGLRRYDPLKDPPPLRSDPVGSKREKAMTSLAYLGAIARINAERKRGARADEVAHHARLAGYPDGRAVSGWNSRAGSTRVIENIKGERVLNAAGHEYIRELAAELGIEIVGDISPLAIPRSSNDHTEQEKL